MALTDYKIREWDSPIINEADRPKKSAEEMKAAFDSNSNQLRTALNALIDALANGEGGDISMPQLSEGIPAAKLSDQLRAVLEEALEGVRSDDIVAIRIGDVGQLEVTFDGAEWAPVAGSGEGGGTDIAALPVAEDIEPPDGFLMYDASLKLPRRALWDKIRSKLSTSFLSTETYASEDPATVKRAAEAAKLEVPRMIGSAAFDGTEDVGLDAIGAQPATLVLQNVAVEMSAWQDNTTYTEYPYRAAIAIDGTTQTNYAEVVYAPAEQSSGNYAGVADTYDGGVYIYAKALPSADITIPTIKVEAAGSGNVGGGSGGATGGTEMIPVETGWKLLLDYTREDEAAAGEGAIQCTRDIDGNELEVREIMVVISGTVSANFPQAALHIGLYSRNDCTKVDGGKLFSYGTSRSKTGDAGTNYTSTISLSVFGDVWRALVIGGQADTTMAQGAQRTNDVPDLIRSISLSCFGNSAWGNIPLTEGGNVKIYGRL